MFWFFGHEVCGILSPWPAIEPAAPELEAQSLPWTNRQGPIEFYICNTIYTSWIIEMKIVSLASMFWKFTLLWLRVGFCIHFAGLPMTPLNLKMYTFTLGSSHFLVPVVSNLSFQVHLKCPIQVVDRTSRTKTDNPPIVGPAAMILSPLPYFFHLVLFNFLRFLFSFPPPHPQIFHSIFVKKIFLLIWLSLFQGIFPLHYKPRILKRLVIKSCSLMFPVSFVLSQVNFPACYLVLPHSFSWSSIIVIETGEPKKKKKTGEPEPADGIFWLYDWVCQLALRWTGRKPHVPECQSCPDSAQTLHLLLQIVSTWFNVSRKKKRRRPSIIPHIIFTAFSIPYLAWWGFPDGSVGKESACNAGDPGLISGLGKSPGEGNGNPLQYFCLENRMDRGTPWATVHGSQRVRHS